MTCDGSLNPSFFMSLSLMILVANDWLLALSCRIWAGISLCVPVRLGARGRTSVFGLSSTLDGTSLGSCSELLMLAPFVVDTFLALLACDITPAYVTLLVLFVM